MIKVPVNILDAFGGVLVQTSVVLAEDEFEAVTMGGPERILFKPQRQANGALMWSVVFNWDEAETVGV